MENMITEYPKEGKKDKVYTMLKAVVSDTPLVGGTVSELLFSFFSKPVDKRREKWFNNLAETIVELAESTKEIANIINSDIFITTAIRATEIAIKTHQEEKLEFLKNIVKNSIMITDINEIEKMIFLETISEYTPLHIKVLLFMDNPSKCLKDISYRNNFTGCSYETFILKYIPELNENKSILKKIEKDLFNDEFTFKFDYKDKQYTWFGNSPETIPALDKNTTKFGQKFIKYLSNTNI